MQKCTICGNTLKEKNEKNGRTVCAKCLIAKRVFDKGLSARISRVNVSNKHLSGLPAETIERIIEITKK